MLYFLAITLDVTIVEFLYAPLSAYLHNASKLSPEKQHTRPYGFKFPVTPLIGTQCLLDAQEVDVVFDSLKA